MNISNVFDLRNTKSSPSLRMEYMHILFKVCIIHITPTYLCIQAKKSTHSVKQISCHSPTLCHSGFSFSEDTHLIQFSMLLKHFWTIQKLRHVVTLILPGFWTDPSRGLSWKKRFTWKFRVEAFSFIVKVSKRFWTKRNKCLWRWGKN